MKNALAALPLALALAYGPPVLAQSNEELLKELRALRDRVTQLEEKLKAAEAKPAATPQWGMSQQQVQDFNRIAVKTEALEDAVEFQGLKQLKISGYADPSFIYNKAQNRAGVQFLNRVSDDGYNYDNGYMGVASLDFQKEMDGGTKWRLTLMPNRGAGSISDSGGFSLVHEASVSIPLGDLQTRFIAGQIPDWSGYEYVQPTTTKLVTRGLLLDFTEPSAYTAAGFDITRGKWQMKAVLGNMNSTRTPQGSRSPMLAYRVDYAKGEFNGFGFAGVHGKVANFTGNVLDGNGNVINQPNSHLDLFEVDGYFIRGDFTAQGQIGFGRQKNAAISTAEDGSLQDAQWWGISGLLAYKFIPRWEAVARADYIDNHKNGGGLLGYSSADGRNGLGPDPALNCGAGYSADCARGAKRWALALGLNYLFNSNTTIKAEYRLDQADLPVFFDVSSGGYTKTNHLLGTSVVVSF
ncbi:hypothetical protein HNP55_003408 [Paucibacter oligotrophus]|uniref:DUF3138 family protein n=1 Tax=Roseateles oligotrophus TaxID=1769250 RepID=A0A840LE02_9BURK|nr:DUF3138 family protein [Roseateles oligotrophus]MBB4844862.1 hypothetical protein [Roseateles oligotrophus]